MHEPGATLQAIQMKDALPIVADLSGGDAEMQRVIRETIQGLGGLDIIVNKCVSSLAVLLHLWRGAISTQAPASVSHRVAFCDHTDLPRQHHASVTLTQCPPLARKSVGRHVSASAEGLLCFPHAVALEAQI